MCISINPIKEKFNPAFHISTGSIDVDDEKNDHIILVVLQNGYSLNGKNIQWAKVKIGIYKDTPSTNFCFVLHKRIGQIKDKFFY